MITEHSTETILQLKFKFANVKLYAQMIKIIGVDAFMNCEQNIFLIDVIRKQTKCSCCWILMFLLS